MPLALVGGLISKFFVPLSLTVALALLASLVVSVTIIPVLVSVFVKRAKSQEPPREQPPEEDRFGDPLEAEKNAGEVPETDRLQKAEPAPPQWSPRRASPWSSNRLQGAEPDPPDRPVAATEPSSASVGRPPEMLDNSPRPWEPILLLVLLLAVAAVVGAAWTGVLAEVSGSVSEAFSSINFDSPALLVVLGGVLGTLLVLGLVALAVRQARRPARRRGVRALVRLYTPMLLWSLRHRGVVLILAFLLFAGGVATAFFLPVSFFPTSQENILIAEVELPPGTSLQRTSEELEPFEDFLLDDPAVESYQVSVGGQNDLDFNPVRSDNQAQGSSR